MIDISIRSPRQSSATAAVILEGLALFMVIWCKGYVDKK